MTKRFGFTLAEVLITLAIIGVVAALTMPTLINNTSGAQFKTAFKKAMSVLSQAVVMNIALEDYDFSMSTSGTNSSLYNLFTQRATLQQLTSNENYSVYIGTSTAANATATGAYSASNYTFRFNDGIIFSFPTASNTAGCTEESPCKGWIDVNGAKGPNKTVICSSVSDSGSCKTDVTVNDIFPIKFYDQTVAPNSAPARDVLYGAEKK